MRLCNYPRAANLPPRGATRCRADRIRKKGTAHGVWD